MTKHDKCTRCGWPYGTFHICLDRPDEVLKKVEIRKVSPRKGRQIGPRGEAFRDSCSEAQQSRWEQKNAVRNRNMGELYAKGGVGYKDVAREFGVSPSTAQKALRSEAEAGRITLRKRGHTIKTGAL